jgi:SSS family solute:Na+ symporter
VQLAVAQFLGLFWRRGNKQGAIAGMIGGFVTAAVLQWQYPTSVPWLAGLTSGMAGLIINFVLYVGCSYLFRQPPAEQARVDQLFISTQLPAPAGVRARAAGKPSPARG